MKKSVLEIRKTVRFQITSGLKNRGSWVTYNQFMGLQINLSPKEMYKDAIREYRNIFYSNLKHLKGEGYENHFMFEWGSGNSGWNETYKRNMAKIL